jgi:O-antigen ligase
LAGRISLNPEQTLTSLGRLLTYGGVFWLSLQLCRDPNRARRGLRLFVVAGFAYAIYGLLAQFSGSEQILWFRERADVAHVTSTFVNRNSYATYAGLALIGAIGLFLDSLGSLLHPEDSRRVKAERVLRHLLGRGAPLTVAILVIATALLRTASRAGTLSTLFGLVVLTLAMLRAGSIRRGQVVTLSIAVVITGVAVFSLSGDDLTTRLDARESGNSSRRDVYALVVRAIGDAPLLGTGYGSFPDVFPIYRDDSIRGTNTWRRAHNTYLENTLELGIPAAIALFAAIGTCAGYCWLGILRRRRNWVFPSIGVATTALVAAHSSIDFSLQIPAVSIGYAFLLGLACAQSFPTRDV